MRSRLPLPDHPWSGAAATHRSGCGFQKSALLRFGRGIFDGDPFVTILGSMPTPDWTGASREAPPTAGTILPHLRRSPPGAGDFVGGLPADAACGPAVHGLRGVSRLERE